MLTIITIVMVLDVIDRFEGRRVRIVYDQTYPAVSLVFYHILPVFRNKRVIVGVYSDTTCRKLKEHYKFVSRHAPDIAEILDRAYVIKIGRRDSIPFGRLYHYIPEDAIRREFERLEIAAGKLRNDDLLLTFGFYLMPSIYGKWVLRRLIRLLDMLPEEITMVNLSPYGLFDYSTSRVIDRFYDVVVRIVKEEEPLDLGNDIYVIGVEESVTRDIRPGFERFRIMPDGRLCKL